MPSEKKLYSKPAEEFKWGFTAGEHVVHVIGEAGNRNEIELVPGQDHSAEPTDQKVSQQEVFDNAADIKTKEFFMMLAKESAADYEKAYVDNGLKRVLEDVKAYITADHRQSQQNALNRLKLDMQNYHSKLYLRDAQYMESRDHSLEIIRQHKDDLDRQVCIQKYQKAFENYLNGGLVVPEEERINLENERVTEPKDVGIGKLGIWRSTEDSLFPHEPSPNDVKQGTALGVETCYMLSALSMIASRHPEKIKEAMKDNGDGTVTVRFFRSNADNVPEPVFIKVNKTVSKIAGIGPNTYASSSVWVQMMEKAYAAYTDRMNGSTAGMKGIDRKTTGDFMTAFTGESYVLGTGNFGADDPYAGVLYTKNANGAYPARPDRYFGFENDLYNFFDKKINQEGHVITVGTNPATNPREIGWIKDFGIRPGHAYAVNKVFEKEINGVTKKFIQLKDPFGTFMAGYDRNGRLVNQSSPVYATLFAGTDNMGTFNLELTDFQKMFTSFPGISAEDLNEYEAMTKGWKSFRDEYRAFERSNKKGPQGDESFISREDLDSEADEREENLNEIFKDTDFRRNGYVKALNDDDPPMFDYEELGDDNDEVSKDINGPDSEKGMRENEFSDYEELDYDDNKIAVLSDDVEEIPGPLFEQLRTQEGFAAITKAVNNIANDIYCTDGWFMFFNTKPFDQMRDAVYALKDRLNAYEKEDRIITPELAMELSHEFVDLSVKAGHYADCKMKSMADAVAKGDKNSIRAIHRYFSALSLKNLCNNEKPIEPWKDKTADNSNMVLQDMVTRKLMTENGEQIIHDGKTQKELDAALKHFVDYANDNPKLKAKLDPENFAKAQQYLGSRAVRTEDKPELDPPKKQLQLI